MNSIGKFTFCSEKRKNSSKYLLYLASALPCPLDFMGVLHDVTQKKAQSSYCKLKRLNHEQIRALLYSSYPLPANPIPPSLPNAKNQVHAFFLISCWRPRLTNLREAEWQLPGTFLIGVCEMYFLHFTRVTKWNTRPGCLSEQLPLCACRLLLV